MIALEASAGLVRGINVRAGRADSATGESITEVLQLLNAKSGEPVRIVLRGVKGTTNLVVEKPSFEVGGIEQYVPIAVKDMIYDKLPLAETRTLVSAVSRAAVVEALEECGITESFEHPVEAVGLASTSLAALATAINGGGDLLFAAPPRFLLLKRRLDAGGAWSVSEISSPDEAMTAEWVTGPEASSTAAVFAESGAKVLPLPHGFNDEFALADGALFWGTPAFPKLPDMEPRARRELRERLRADERTDRKLSRFGIVLATVGILVFAAAWMWRANAEAGLRTVEEEKSALETEAARLRTSLPPLPADNGANLGERVRSVLAAISASGAVVRIVEVQADRNSNAKYPGLSKSGSENAALVKVAGRTRAIQDVERLRGFLETRGFTAIIESADVTAERGLPVRFNMAVR